MAGEPGIDDIPRRPSKEGHKVNALALGAEEGRDKLRKAAERSKYPLTRRYPNGGTHLGQCLSIVI